MCKKILSPSFNLNFIYVSTYRENIILNFCHVIYEMYMSQSNFKLKKYHVQ